MTDGNEFDQIFPLGEKNDAYAQFFPGQSYLAPLTSGSVPVANVTFEPGCRNHWHL
jgi:quercetin dioxygenase-like cupin family protein